VCGRWVYAQSGWLQGVGSKEVGGGGVQVMFGLEAKFNFLSFGFL